MSPIYDINSRTKPHLIVGTIGDRASGKTTLTAAILKFLASKGMAQELAIDQIDKEKEEKIRGMTIDCNIVEYTTENRHYAHVDCPGDLEYADNMARGVSVMDCAILVVDVGKGVSPSMMAQITLAAKAGVHNFVVFVNKCEAEEPQQDLLEAIDRVIPCKEPRFIHGSAQRAFEGDTEAMEKIASLMAALDQVPEPSRDVDHPFRMQVMKTLSVTGKGTVATGRVAAGRIKVGDEVDVIGLRDKTKAVVTGVQSFGCELAMGQAGDFVGLLFGGLKPDDVLRGQTICAPDSATAYKMFEMEAYVLYAETGGRDTPFALNCSPRFQFGAAEVTGVFVGPDVGSTMIQAGAKVKATVELKAPLALQANDRFAIRDGKLVLAQGMVQTILH